MLILPTKHTWTQGWDFFAWAVPHGLFFQICFCFFGWLVVLSSPLFSIQHKWKDPIVSLLSSDSKWVFKENRTKNMRQACLVQAQWMYSVISFQTFLKIFLQLRPFVHNSSNLFLFYEGARVKRDEQMPRLVFLLCFLFCCFKNLEWFCCFLFPKSS